MALHKGMRHSLTRHTSTGSPAATVEAEIKRTADKLTLDYQVTGGIEQLVIPELVDRSRADELWKHTCFEAFIMPEQGGGYSEFNLSPSGRWAAYHFKSHRSGMTNIAEVSDPGIGTREFGDVFQLRAVFDISRIPNLGGNWKVGLSVILEAADGVRSYWAIRHPENKLDFHHLDCFAMQLPSAG